MVQRARVVATACLLCLPRIAATQAVPAQTPDRTKVVAAVAQIMEKARYCVLVTIGRDGHPQARVVDPLPPERDLTVWIATNPISRKVEQIRTDPRVTLFYFDPSGPGYVTLLAKAELVSDPVEKARYWKEDWAAFYASKNRGEDFILIRCKPDSARTGQLRSWTPERSKYLAADYHRVSIGGRSRRTNG